MEITDKKLNKHRCRKGKESHWGGGNEGASTVLVILLKWYDEYMDVYFISLYTISICLKCLLMHVYVVENMCIGERKNVKEREGRLERDHKGERRRGYRASKSTGFTSMYGFW